jgi:hypothetical protein
MRGDPYSNIQDYHLDMALPSGPSEEKLAVLSGKS